MSVFTNISESDVSRWLETYSIGDLIKVQGISSGIENTNYFLDTDRGRFVLTIFEKLKYSELFYYLGLMSHLAKHGLPVPNPVANRNNEFLGELKKKPAAIVSYLKGKPVTKPDAKHCAQVGKTLAHIHQIGFSYKRVLDNVMGQSWWESKAPEIYPFVDRKTRDLIQVEIEFQASLNNNNLPKGVIHADMFRDNVLFDGEMVGGVIDFYFACNDLLVYDLAITVNDWCRTENSALDVNTAKSLINAYTTIRRLTRNEIEAWPSMLRAAALRFWISRLYDFYLPRSGELTHSHPPLPFQRLVEHYSKFSEKYADLIDRK